MEVSAKHCTWPLLFVAFTAKPTDNLPLKVFQRYFAHMADAIKECPETFAIGLYSKKLIGRETRDKVLRTQGLAPLEKAYILLSGVEPTIATSKDDKTLKKFCGAMSKVDNLRRLSKRIMKKHG